MESFAQFSGLLRIHFMTQGQSNLYTSLPHLQKK